MAIQYKAVGTGRTYETMSAATAGIAAVGGGIVDPWVFCLENQIFTDLWTGFTASYGATATNTITVRPNFVGSGVGSNSNCGFADLHDYSSVPLELDMSGSGGATMQYDAGSAINFAPFFGGNHVTVQGIQIQGASTIVNLVFDNAGNNCWFQRNFVRGRPAVTVSANACDCLVANNLFVSEGNFDLTNFAATGTHDTYVVHNTFVQTMNVAANVFVDSYLGFGGGTLAHIFGNACYTNGSGEAYHDVGGAGNNANQVGRNISNTATDVWATANSSQSGSISADLEAAQQTAVNQSRDFRPKPGGLLMGYIPAASYYNPAAFPNCAATDIRGQTRVTGSPLIDVGCFQRTGAGAPVNILINLNSAVVDNGLNDIVTNGTRVHVCSSLPTTYATALSTSLGNSAIVFGSPQTSVAGDGRKVSSIAIVSTGSITATGTVSHWAVVDIAAGGRLLAAGPIDAPEAVTSGMVFSLGSLALVLPRK